MGGTGREGAGKPPCRLQRLPVALCVMSCAAGLLLGSIRRVHTDLDPHLVALRPAAATQGASGSFQQCGSAGRCDGQGNGARVGDAALEAILAPISRDKEILVAVTNSALINADGTFGMLRTWLDAVQNAGVVNYVVVCLDDREFLLLGYSVLLSDVDVVVLKNPFDRLYRDRDVEGMSDGFDPVTAYGYDDVFDDPLMGWSRYAHTMRIFVLNSGFFYIRPNCRTVALMERITSRLMKETAWDQVRILNIYDFVNSKTLFRTMRNEEQYTHHTPVAVHVNYHPDKWPRMKAVVKRYVDGDVDALSSFPTGSCHGAPNC
ncbi:unnamed protein product [Ostreobium quekettii]|uniref:Nucleotide-diphospho-sugar transferase domain-containing protein n=1 Tax=Ostreobium quekettii TaxID=121088 RepID=A0A8S1J763_9CHLO|nr:unnamed protein product [Ostreobium quekettii]